MTSNFLFQGKTAGGMAGEGVIEMCWDKEDKKGVKGADGGQESKRIMEVRKL